MSDWVPGWLGQWRKAVPAGVIALVLLILLVTAPPKTEDTLTDVAATGPSGTSTELPDDEPAEIDDNIVPSDDGPAVAGPSGEGPKVDAKSDGAGSGIGIGGGGATYKGVADKSIKMGFTWQHAQCGNFFGPGIAAAFGVPQPNEEESIRAAIEYYERFPTKAFPNLPKDLAKGVSPTTGYWGRRVQPVLEDNGGPLCADKARATAVKLAEQDKVFGSVQIPNDGANEFVATELAARKLLNIGGPGFTREMYDKWEPYVYDITFSGSDVVAAWASWACRDLWKKNSIDTGDLTTANKQRVFAVVHPDSPVAATLAKEAKTAFAKCGGQIKTTIAYPTALDQQPGAASNAVAQFRTNNVTSVLMFTDPLFASQLSSAATGQGFLPEWLVTSVGFNDVAFVVRHFYDENQRRNILGSSHLSSSDRVKWSETTQYKAWKMVRPNEEPPGDWNNWFLNISILYAGILGAGPDLDPQTFLTGLNEVCSPCARPSKKATYVSFGPKDTTGVDDFTLVRFNTEKEDVYDPPDQYGRRQIGYWDFPEKGLRYYRTISSPER